MLSNHKAEMLKKAAEADALAQRAADAGTKEDWTRIARNYREIASLSADHAGQARTRIETPRTSS